MAPRAIALSLLLALAVPALAPPAAAACEPLPDCAVALAAESAAPALEAGEDAYALAAPWVGLMEGYAGQFLGPAVPDSSDSIVLAGPGVATVRLASGTSGTCSGEPRMVVEASRKSFGLEPTVTMSYSGGQGEGGLLFPCAMGEQRQPAKADITGDFDGAWHAVRGFPTFTWRIDASAPAPDGTRAVSYVYEHQDGSRHTFEGVLAEYR